MEMQAALLEWVNSFTITEDVISLSELTDGYILWDILRDVDPIYFTSSLPEGRSNTTKWIPRYENLKYLHKTLVSYISEECDQALFAPRAGDGLQAIAKDASLPDFLKLFQLVLQATISSPRQQEYILKMTSLTDTSKKTLKELIENREETVEADDQQDDDLSNTDTPIFATDAELAHEERYGSLMAENAHLRQERKETESELRDTFDRLIRLQESYDVLKQDLTEAQDSLQMNACMRNGTESRSVKELESRIRQQENDFADQEIRMEKHERKLEAVTKKNANLEASLNSSAKKARDAKDELDEVRKERDAYAKKANMVEKFKQQLQASSGLKKENEELRSRLEDYHGQDADFENIRHENAGLVAQIEEYKKLVPRIEEDNAESFRVRGQLQLDNESLRKDLSRAQKQNKQYQATIAQLNQRVRSSSISSSGSHENEDLEAEITSSTAKQAVEDERVSNAEKETKWLNKRVREQALEMDSLRRQLDEANNRLKQENGSRRPSLETPLPAEKTGSSLPYGLPYLNGNAYPAYNSGSAEPNTSAEIEKLQLEVKRLQEALLSKPFDIHAPLPDHPELTPEIKALAAQVKNGEKTVDDNTQNVDYLTRIIMQGRKDIFEAEKIVEQQKTIIADLETRLKNAELTAAKVEQEAKPPPPPELQSLRTENATLKRELKLIASAFHDQSSRLQYIGTTVQRRSEMPSSWLARQRRIVEGNFKGGGVRR
ncbi:MAG: hypothetical protein Q9182_001000 [Xanthomendoza sp. 2 TL-2023]